MNYGELLVQLLTRAIEHEEADLEQLRQPTSKQCVKSVAQYNEHWIHVPLLKEALGRPLCPMLDWEKEKVDVTLLEEKYGKYETLARVELKTFFKVRPDSKKDAILEGFSKQCKRARKDERIEHYVALIPSGERKEIEEWTKKLPDEVRRKCPGSEVEEVLVEGKPTNPVDLNVPERGCAWVRVFHIKAG